MDMGVSELGGLFRIISYLTALRQTDRYLIYIASLINSSMSLSKGRRWIKAFASCSREHLKGP